MKIAHEGKDHGVKEIILSSVVASGRGNADVLIHFNELQVSLQGKWVLFCK